MKNIAKVIAIILILTLVGGCGVKNNKVESINISYVKLPLNVPSIVEKNLELFEKEYGKDDIKVVFPEITQGPKMTEAMAAGSLDFCNALGGTSAILAKANGVNLKVIGIYSRAPQAFTIMTKNESFKSMQDLKGKKIAGPKGTILHQLLLAGLNEEGLQVEDVEFINMGISEAMSALASDKIDAALIAGPAVPQALKAGAQVLLTGEGLLDATIVIAVREEFLKEHKDLVARYMQVHQESLDYMQENPEKVYEMVAKETNISLEAVEKMYGWYDFNPEITENDIKELEKTQEFLKSNGMLNDTIDLEELLENI